MPTTTIPLVGPFTRRQFITTASLDQLFRGCVFETATNSLVGDNSVWVVKRQGLSSGDTIASGSYGIFVFPSENTSHILMGFGDFTTTTIYDGTTNTGVVTGVVFSAMEVVFSGVTYWLMVDSDNGTGWFVAQNSIEGATTTFTGDTHTNTTIDNLSGAQGAYVGQLITGTGIAANTRVATRTPDTTTPTSITTTVATTATNAGITITRQSVAKILSAGFPAIVVGQFAELNGFVFVMSNDGKIYNSNLNDVTTWGAGNFISCNTSTDKGSTVVRYKNLIVGFGFDSIEYLFNAGNSSGSPLAINREMSVTGIGTLSGSAGRAVLVMLDKLYFIDLDERALYVIDGRAPKRLSNPGVMALSTYQPRALSPAISGSKSLLLITAGASSAQECYFYDPDTGYFTGTGMTSIIPNSGTKQGATYYVDRGSTSGKRHAVDSSGTSFQDAGATLTMTIQTEPKVLNKGRPFIIKNTRLLADNQSSGSTTYSQSADDYTNFVDIGVFDLTTTQKQVYGGLYCESFCAFKLADAGNNPWRGQAIEVEWEPCA